MNTPDGGLRGRAGGRAERDAEASPARPPWCVVAGALAVVLAVASVAVVLVSDDARWLRLAVVAALWSALVGAIVLIRRAVAHDAAGRHEVTALRRRYTRELEREVAARREYEATLERDLRRELARELADSRDSRDSRDEELASMRGELDRLREERDAATAAPVTAAPVTAAPVTAAPVAPARVAPAPVTPAAGRAVRAPSRGAHATASSQVVPAPPSPPTRPVPRAAGAPTPPSPLSFSRADPVAPTSVEGAEALLADSFVDQYVRSTGYGPPSGVPDPAAGADVPSESRRTRSGGRSVRDLLAAHSAHPQRGHAARGASGRPSSGSALDGI